MLQEPLLEFSANKSCPDLSHSTLDVSAANNVQTQDTTSEQIYLRTNSFPLLSRNESVQKSINELPQAEAGFSSTKTQHVSTLTDDVIEVLSCHVVEPEHDVPSQVALMAAKLPNGDCESDDASAVHRKRVARAVGVITFLLLLFSIVLIGISLNMSKNIDEMVAAFTTDHTQDPPEVISLDDDVTTTWPTVNTAHVASTNHSVTSSSSWRNESVLGDMT